MIIITFDNKNSYYNKVIILCFICKKKKIIIQFKNNNINK